MSTEPQEMLDDIFATDRDRDADSAASTEEVVQVDMSNAPVKELTEAVDKIQEGEGEQSSPEPQEEQPEPSEPEAQETAEQPQETSPEPQGRHVPLKELQSERGKRQEEARLRAEAEARAKVYEQQLQTLMQQQAAQPQPQAQPEPQPEMPDFYEDPDGWAKFQQEQMQKTFDARLAEIEQANINRHVNASHHRANAKYGQDVVQKALEAAGAAGVAQRFQTEADPFESLMTWHKRTQILETTGGDLDSFLKQREDELRKQILEELKAGKQPVAEQPNGAQPQPQPIPVSLTDAPATGQQGGMISQQALAEDVFSPGR